MYTFVYYGLEFTVSEEPDTDSGPPWKQCDMYITDKGIRSGVDRGSKRPSERVLCRDRHGCTFYDWNAAMREARKEHKTGKAAHEAVEREFKYLRGWCHADWWYEVIGVTLEFDDEEYSAYIGWVESNADEYKKELVQDLAYQALESMLRDQGLTVEQCTGPKHEAPAP